MKTKCFAATALFAALVSSQAAILEQDSPLSEDRDRADIVINLPAQKPNEVARGNVVYSGVFVQMVSADKPFELINPLAPADAGRAEDNTAFDSITGKSEGIKLFAISF